MIGPPERPLSRTGMPEEKFSRAGHEVIQAYFPHLSPTQYTQLKQLEPLYHDWNSKINVISRKDMEAFYLHHVLHSLAIAKFITFAPGTQVLDIGTGGGFPGIPLAIMFPDTKFTLVDSIGKKISVVKAVAKDIQLSNITALHERVEKVDGKYDFIVSRAVAELKLLHIWTRHKLSTKSFNEIPNGWILLKGGDLTEEITALNKPVLEKNLSTYFTQDFFETKKLVYFS